MKMKLTGLQRPFMTPLLRKTDMVFEANSELDTYELGVDTGKTAKPGDVFCLTGDLGTGKTVFTAGLAKGLGIGTPVCSPTFTILQTYEEGRLPLYHFDVYRIADPEEMFEIGFDDYVFGEGVCIIEWGEMIEEILPEKTKYITIEKDLSKGFDYRKITICEKKENNL